MRKPLWITVLEGDITTSPTFTTVTRVTVVNAVPRVTVVNVGLVLMSRHNLLLVRRLSGDVTL